MEGPTKQHSGAPHLLQRDYWSERAIRRAFAAFLAQHREQLQGKRILDYGAADSPYSAMAASIGATMLAADIGDPGPEGVRIDPDGHVHLPDDSVDAAISTQVLEHVPDVQRYLGEAMRVLKPGAPMLITTHGDWILHRVPTDFRRWTVDGLRYECESAGLQLESVTPAVGILASSTHLRTIVVSAVLKRTPVLRWLEPMVVLAANLRMGLEDLITPASVMESHPQIIIVLARKPSTR